MAQSDSPSNLKGPVSAGGAAASAGVRFQAQVGALAELWLLADEPVDLRFGLGDAKVESVRFETEAPVDDVLIATTEGGFIAIQAKTSASLSRDPRSPLGKTVEQFVGYWRACRVGSGQQGWDRPLDRRRDRLVLAVGPQTSGTIRNDLAAALRLRAQPGAAVPTQAQKRALVEFDALVASAWSRQSADPLDPQLLSDLADLVVIFVFDPEGADGHQFEAKAPSLLETGDPRSLQSLLAHSVGLHMSTRGGVDLPLLRQELSSRGVRLRGPPRFQRDIAKLRAVTNETLNSLSRYEVILNPTHEVRVRRDCQSAVDAAAHGGSLLIVGEPGAGKSAVINALTRELLGAGHDVLELAVDRYSVESLEGLSRELDLDNSLLKVLDAWDGPGPAWLIIDALDATRGGRGEGAFRSLIQHIQNLDGRWRVIASIRTFDLRMGHQFRALFQGSPPVAAPQEVGFRSVRHIKIPPWSTAEFSTLLDQAPPLAAALDGASPRLRELASVPFNTRLISELVADIGLKAKLARVDSQTQLLSLYWDHRVAAHGAPARACLHRIVSEMVDGRSLRAPVLSVSGTDPSTIDTLCREGVIIRVEADRWIQFRHHLLFDYAAAQLLLDPSEVVSGARRFPKEDALGLMLAPALTFLLQEIWDTETDHARFWIAVGNIIADASGDPIIRSAAGRQSAAYPEVDSDTAFLAGRVMAGDANTIRVLEHVAGALAVRLEDESDVNVAPWVCLIGGLAPAADRVTNVLRFLVMLVLERAKPAIVTAEIGKAARALLRHGLILGDPKALVATTIPFVADTYTTDPAASRQLLEQVFEPQRIVSRGWEEVPSVCRKIGVLTAVDPQFAVNVYAKTFSFTVTDERKTHLGSSNILSLTSNARQDYGMAQFALNEHIETFLKASPLYGADAVVGGAEGYVARAHPMGDEAALEELTIKGQTVRLAPDGSYIWAHDVEAQYRQDGEVLIAKFLRHLRAVDEPTALQLVARVIPQISYAVLWSRLFMAAAARRDKLLDLLWPYAANEAFLVLADTRKDAVDVVANGYNRQPRADRVALERAVFEFDFSAFSDPEAAKNSLLRRLFRAIGSDRLQTGRAKAFAPYETGEVSAPNDRLFQLQTTSRALGAFDWIDDLDRAEPEQAALIAAIEETKRAFCLEEDKSLPKGLTLTSGLGALEALAAQIAAADTPEGLIRSAEDAIVQGCSRIVDAKLLMSPTARGEGDTDERFLRLLALGTVSPWPVVAENTEREFEDHQSWGGPAPRVDAAQVVLNLCPERPDLYPRLEPMTDQLLQDAHPAVRLQAATYLVRIWDIDREGFWRRTAERLDLEANPGVVTFLIDGVIGRVLHADPARSEALCLRLLDRSANDRRRQVKVEFTLSDKLTILWVTHQRPRSHECIEQWIADPVANGELLQRVLSTLREAVSAGLRDTLATPVDTGLRHRAQAVVSEIVEAASLRLAPYLQGQELSETEGQEARRCAQILDTACQELFFATGGGNGSTFPDEQGRALFLREMAPTLHRIGDLATPHTVYNLLQMLEGLADADPEAAFDIAAHALLAGGKTSGYQFDHMGVEVMVRLTGVFLADHKEVFEDPDRRRALIDCLETFMEAGWPAARRLLYRLPELIQ